MTKNRLVRILFSIFIFAGILRINPSFAIEANKTTFAGEDKISYDGNCKLSDKDIENYYKEGYKYAKEAHDALNAMINGGSFSSGGASYKVQGLKNIYQSDSGVCGYLQGNSQETSAREMRVSSTGEDGARLYDKKYGSSPTCESYIKFVNDSDNKNYTDWNLTNIRKEAGKASVKLQKIIDWAKTAKVNDYMYVDDTELDKAIDESCGTVYDSSGRENNCEVIIKGSGDSFYCYDPSTMGNYMPYKGSEKFHNAKVNKDHIGVQFKTPEDFLKKVDTNVNKCLTELEILEGIRAKFVEAHKGANTALDLVAVMEGKGSDNVKIECTCETVNSEYTGKVDKCVAMDSDRSDDHVDEGCKPIMTYAQEISSDCVICGLFATILGAVQMISKQAFEATADGMMALLGVAFGIFIAYQTLLSIANPEEMKLSKYLNELITQGFKVAITILILKNPTFLYQQVLTPILDSAVDFGLAMIGIEKAAAAELGSKYISSFNMNSDYLPGTLMRDLTGTLHNFQNAAAEMPGMGRSLMCYAFDNLQWDPNMGFIPRFSMLMNGILLYVFGLGIMLSIGFYMLDCALALGLVCALMAFFVTSWPFKITTGYTKTGWNMFLNVFFNFIMMSVVIKTIVELSTQAVSGGNKEQLMSLMAAGDPEALDSALGFGGLQIVLVIICCMLCFKLPKETGRLANKFAGGAQIQMGGELGGMAASAVKSATVGKLGEKDQDGKTQGVGGAAGLIGKAAGGAISSAAEHSGAKGAMNKAGGAIKNAASRIAGKMGIGKKAQMGSKGRDQGANQDRQADFK